MKQKIKEYAITKRQYLKPLLIYLIISLVMFWEVTINFFSSVVNGYGDVYQSMFNLWWTPYSIFVLHQSPYFTNFLFYPIGAELVTQTLTPLAGIFSLPLQALGSAFAYNFLFFSSFALSGIFMFALANYFVKNRYAAFIAGLIFAFSPMHIAQSYSHLDWTIIEWVPLFLYFYVRTINEQKARYAVFGAISFLFLTFMGDIEQGIMVLFATIVFTLLYLLFDRSKLLNRKALMNIGLLVVITLLLSSPFLLAMYPYLTAGVFSAAQQNSAVVSNMMWSDNLLSFFLPSYYNGLFHSLSLSYTQQIYALTYKGVSYQTNVAERVSYVGYAALALSALAVYADYKRHRLKNVGIWLALGLFFAWMSLGPYLQIYGTVSGIPTIYMLYRALPIFNIIREPGRFDMITTICIAMLAAYGFVTLTSGKEKKHAFRAMVAVSIIILIEYNGMPLSGSFASQLITSTNIPVAYSQIGKIPGNFSVLILPDIPNSSATPAYYPGLATYYVTAMKKPIIGGYTSRETANESLSVSLMPLSLSAAYLEQGDGLVYPSPISENITNLTMLWLANYNTAFISVQLAAYNATSQAQLLGYLSSAFGQPVYYNSTEETAMFSTEGAVRKYAGKSIVSYISGNWTPGYSLCNPYQQCNQTLASMWWGQNPRAIVLFSPKAQRIKMSLNSMSLTNGTVVQVYLGSNIAGYIPVYGRESSYHLNFTAPQGFSEIGFYSNSTASSLQQEYLTYGFNNITFTAT